MKNNEKRYKSETIAVHGGYFEVEPTTRSRVVPLYQTTSYTFKDTEHAAKLFSLEEPGNIYTRIMNPTTDVLEKRIAELEHGIGALALSSGQAAANTIFLTLLRKGDNIVSSSEIYGGTFTLFHYTLGKLGISTTFVDPKDPENFKGAIKQNTGAIFVETLGNPNLEIPDFEEIAKIAHDFEIPLVVDNTFASPYLCNPIDWGADIVMHSTTKYISGHGYAIGGVIVDSGKFDWGRSSKYSWFDSPDPSYHGLNFYKSFGKAAFIAKARVQTLRDVGGAPSPFNSWLTLVGLETLHLRMERISENALKIAKFLQNHPKVEWVNYPGLKSGKQRELLDKYLNKKLYSGMMGFGLKGGYDAAINLINNVKLISHLANIGDAKTLIIHPASTTHQQLTEEEQRAAGITPDFIRLSVGIENADDLIQDLEDALEKI